MLDIIAWCSQFISCRRFLKECSQPHKLPIDNHYSLLDGIFIFASCEKCTSCRILLSHSLRKFLRSISKKSTHTCWQPNHVVISTHPISATAAILNEHCVMDDEISNCEFSLSSSFLYLSLFLHIPLACCDHYKSIWP